ncbi:CsbD family protein [Acidithiobacillus thiooxidans]|uniref:CsbD family protein n=1 Tax=Acidithiobacillus thiooxidans TaxID=930 RepID=UPI0004B94A6E|nr:CsbD family protein [Acidithiobacillus thiooxidans]MBU2837700.1 CsbD family protein [Acidithiobacillus thiooxidans]MDA8151280.1 CsbD family protein [Acidithiobacillus sp.]
MNKTQVKYAAKEVAGKITGNAQQEAEGKDTKEAGDIQEKWVISKRGSQIKCFPVIS